MSYKQAEKQVWVWVAARRCRVCGVWRVVAMCGQGVLLFRLTSVYTRQGLQCTTQAIVAVSLQMPLGLFCAVLS